MICIEFPICPSAFVYAISEEDGQSTSLWGGTMCKYLRLTSRSFQFPGTYYVFDLLKTKLLSNEVLISEVELSYEFI